MKSTSSRSHYCYQAHITTGKMRYEGATVLGLLACSSAKLQAVDEATFHNALQTNDRTLAACEFSTTLLMCSTLTFYVYDRRSSMFCQLFLSRLGLQDSRVVNGYEHTNI